MLQTPALNVNKIIKEEEKNFMEGDDTDMITCRMCDNKYNGAENYSVFGNNIPVCAVCSFNEEALLKEADEGDHKLAELKFEDWKQVFNVFVTKQKEMRKKQQNDQSDKQVPKEKNSFLVIDEKGGTEIIETSNVHVEYCPNCDNCTFVLQECDDIFPFFCSSCGYVEFRKEML